MPLPPSYCRDIILHGLLYTGLSSNFQPSSIITNTLDNLNVTMTPTSTHDTGYDNSAENSSRLQEHLSQGNLIFESGAVVTMILPDYQSVSESESERLLPVNLSSHSSSMQGSSTFMVNRMMVVPDEVDMTVNVLDLSPSSCMEDDDWYKVALPVHEAHWLQAAFQNVIPSGGNSESDLESKLAAMMFNYIVWEDNSDME
ncbi:hypothetical protein BDR07DRAFT_1382964 [Suillus spraguei]|nr:hypothetical protein BDR07DRAFT_1382964 [Suillus spraguei]